MSIDYDLVPQAPSATPAAAPAAPNAPGPAATRLVPVSVPDEPAPGELKAFLAFGGPAVALIAGCWLLWAFGPWLLLGALALAAIAAATAASKALARARRSRSEQRAARPTRAGPGGRGRGDSGRRGLFGRRGTGGTHRAPGGSGGMGPVRPAPRVTTAGAAAVRGAQRRSLLSGATPSGRTSPAGRGGTGKTFSGGPGPGGGFTNPTKTIRANGGTGATRGVRAGGTGMGSGAGSGKGGTRAAARTGTGFGLLRRTLGKTMPVGRPGATSGTRTSAAGKHTPAKTRATGATGAAVSLRKRFTSGGKKKRITAGGVTASGRRKIRVGPKAAKTIARRAALTRAKAARAGKGKVLPKRSSAARRLARTVKRAATHRKVRAARTRALRGTRRVARAGNRVVSPLAIRGFLAVGRVLGWAQRRMLRVASASSGPIWAPRLASGVARGIGVAMAAGMWVAKRRHVQKWMLLHYAAAGIGTPSSLLNTKPSSNPAAAGTGHTAKPGPAVRITRPTSPTPAPRGATMSGTNAADDIAEMFEQMLGTFQPESPVHLTQHFEQLGPMLERFAAATVAHAQRLQDEYEVRGPVIDMVETFGQAFGGMHDLATEVVASWRAQHADDLARHEEPRASEQTFWNYQGGE